VTEPQETFGTFRRANNTQHELFIGENTSDIVAKGGVTRSMMSGLEDMYPRARKDLLPLGTEAQIFQSLAKGGFTESLGPVCALY